MMEEYYVLMNNHTWSIIPIPPHRTTIRCRWIFKIKQNTNGSINRYKSQLVAKGNHQKPDFDFSETFSPVVQPTTIHTVLSIVVSKCWEKVSTRYK